MRCRCGARAPVVCGVSAPLCKSSRRALDLTLGFSWSQPVLDALAPHLARLLCDPAEKCRELAAGLLRCAVARCVDGSTVLAAAAPSLAQRARAAAEAVEELRLAHVAVVGAAACSPGCRPSLAAHAADLAAVLCPALREQFADLVRAAAAASAALAAALPGEALAGCAPALLQSLLVAVQHRHSAVRLAALAALHSLALSGALARDAVLLTLLPGARPLAFDAAPAVRLALYDAAAGWLAEPRVIAAGDVAHLLPLLLLGATDEAPGAAEAALGALERACAAALPGAAAGAPATEERHGEHAQAAAPLWLPAPMARRPRASARQLVIASLPALLRPALADLKAWTPGVRAAAARLLLALCCCCEGEAAGSLDVLVPALCAAMGDDDASQAARILSVVHILGRHTAVRVWLPLVLECAVGERSGGCGATAGPTAAPAAPGPTQRACALVILAALLRTCAQLGARDACAVADALAAPQLAEACAEPGPLRAQAALAAASLVAAASRTAGAHAGGVLLPAAPQLFRTLLALRTAGGEAGCDDAPHGGGGAHPTASPSSPASVALTSLDEATGGTLYAEHAGALLRALCSECGSWASPSAPGFAALRALLRVAPPDALRPHAQLVASALGGCCRAEAEGGGAGLALAALRALDAVLEEPPQAAALAPAAPALMRQLLAPLLVWRAGRTAAAVRYAALVALCTFLRTAAQHLSPDALAACASGAQLVGSLGGCLEEDYYADMRLAAAHALHLLLTACGAALLSPDQRQRLQGELVRRLEDSRDEVRAAAATVLLALLHARPPPDGPAADQADGAPLLAALMLHLDDPAELVRRAVGCAAVEAARVHPAAAREAATAARAVAQHKECYDAVLAVAASQL